MLRPGGVVTDERERYGKRATGKRHHRFIKVLRRPVMRLHEPLAVRLLRRGRLMLTLDRHAQTVSTTADG